MERMPTQVNKARKNDKITRTPEQRKTSEVTPQAKKTNEREQECTKKTKKDRKDDLLKYFREGTHVPAPSTTSSPIDTVLKRRDTKEKEGSVQEEGGEECMT